MIIFLAILMHKIPASIGLGSFLSHCQLSKRTLFGHLLAFTATSPISCIVTFLILCGIDIESSDTVKLQSYVGVILLLSAGTFLYVSTIHILPEVYCNPSKDLLDHSDHSHEPEEHVHSA